MGLLQLVKKLDPIGYAGAREGLRLGQQVATLGGFLPNPANFEEKNGKIAWQPTRGFLPPPAPSGPMPGPAPSPGAGGVGLMNGMPGYDQAVSERMAMQQQQMQPPMPTMQGPPMNGMASPPQEMSGAAPQGPTQGLLHMRQRRMPQRSLY